MSFCNSCNRGFNRFNQSREREREVMEPVQAVQAVQPSRRCDCRELFSGISRNQFVRIQLKSSTCIEGFFLGVFGEIVTLFDVEHGCVSSKTICCEDVVAVTSFSEREHCRDDRR